MLAAWCTLIVFAITTIMTQTGLLKFWTANMLISESQLITIPQTLGISSLYLIIPFCLLTLWIAFKTKPTEFFPKQPFKQYWSGHFTATILGLVSLLAWALSAETGREFGLSFSIPLGHSLQYLMLGQQRYLNWGTYLVVGLVLGSLISAKIAGELKWKPLSGKECGKSLVGGVLMGIGAALAGWKNAVVYDGGWNDWQMNSQLSTKLRENSSSVVKPNARNFFGVTLRTGLSCKS